jgi:hypothetical protein
VYDIRGVFDGSIIKNGFEGYPSILYTSTYTSRLGAVIPGGEQEGAETQSIGKLASISARVRRLLILLSMRRLSLH